MAFSENRHVSTVGLAFTEQELRNLEKAEYEFTGWYNEHSQPIVRNKNTGEELAVCRMGNYVSNTCNVRIII